MARRQASSSAFSQNARWRMRPRSPPPRTNRSRDAACCSGVLPGKHVVDVGVVHLHAHVPAVQFRSHSFTDGLKGLLLLSRRQAALVNPLFVQVFRNGLPATRQLFLKGLLHASQRARHILFGHASHQAARQLRRAEQDACGARALQPAVPRAGLVWSPAARRPSRRPSRGRATHASSMTASLRRPRRTATPLRRHASSTGLRNRRWAARRRTRARHRPSCPRRPG